MSQYGMSQPQMIMPQYGMPPQANIMTTAHFEILKNKLDAVQLELVDLLRNKEAPHTCLISLSIYANKYLYLPVFKNCF